ncbi:plasmid stabilization protein [Streptacidiphilus sp. PAMC 29251]
MPRGSSPKRERQYEHIKEGEQKRGVGTKRAEEIAARTVNKERARAGETGPSYRQLYAEAQRRNLKGRSMMRKADLARALS